MERRLGRGLGSLLSKPSTSEPTREVELRLIQPNPFQPRKVFDPVALEELRNSIREHGVIQPVVLRTHGEGYQLIAGERRWRASRLVGRETIPAVIRDDIADEQMLELALVENVQRDDLDPLEKARAFQALQEQLGLTQDQVALKVGLRRSTVTNHLRLLELPEGVQEAVSNRLIGMGHARALLGLDSAEAQLEALERTVREDLSVRDVEQLVRDAIRPRPAEAEQAGEAAPARGSEPAWVKEISATLQEALGTKVRISSDANCRAALGCEMGTPARARRRRSPSSRRLPRC